MSAITTGTVTAITASPRQAGRFVVEVDGREFAIVGLEVIDRFKLAVGREVAAIARALEKEAAALKTYDRALNMLASRARSARDLRRRLLRTGAATEDVDVAITLLTERGYLDDAAFAEQLVRSKVAGAGWAPRRLEQELRRCGVSREIAADAIERGADTTADTIERIARKKLRSLASLDDRSRARRLFAFLARRGYDADAIRQVMERLEPIASEDAPAER